MRISLTTMFYNSKKYYSLLLVFALMFFVSNAQTTSMGKDFGFIQQLYNQKLYKEVIYAADNLDTSSFKIKQYDTLNYYKGICHFQINNNLLSKDFFLKVSNQSAHFIEANFYAAYNATYLKHFNESDTILNGIVLSTNDTLFNELVKIEKSGNALLKRRLNEYQYLDLKESGNYLAEKQRLNKTYTTLINHKRKSPLLAGIMSGILPGSGKWYAGKKGQAIAAFVTQLSLGLLTNEAYKNVGIKSIGCIGYASLFSLFYIGNIWGTVAIVKVADFEFNQTINHEVMVSLKLPLGYVFR